MAGRTAKDDRLLVKQPFKHYRRTYSMVEVRYGFLVLAILLGVGGWVYWKGQNPDPDIFAVGPIAGGTGAPATVIVKGNAPAKSTGSNQATAASKPGPLPAGLASPGWIQGELSWFDKSNLYVKINGRADFFLAFGFQRLDFAALSLKGDEAVTVDLEVYDLGSPANALGAFSGERKATDSPRVSGGGMAFMARNAMFLTRGKYYIRAIGSDESEAIKAQLRHLEKVLIAGMKGSSALPWAYELFVKHLKLAAGKVKYKPTTALSFEFGRDVYLAPGDDGTQLFVVVKDNDGDAKTMADKFVEGFASYGKKLGGDEKVAWVKDPDTGEIATAVASGRFVLGLRGAKNLGAAKAALAALMLGMSEMDPAVKKAAKPAPPAKAAVAPTPTREGEGEGAEPGSEEGM